MEKMFHLVDKNGKNVIIDEYYGCLKYEQFYKTTFDNLKTAQEWVEWAIKHNNINADVEQPISIVELTVTSKKVVK